MAQNRFFSWQDDDSTFALNWWRLGINDSGLYRGFELGLSVGLNLTLVHTSTGATKVDEALALVSDLGIWITKQGGVITEDTSITVPIAANASGNPRIDLIIGNHTYVQSVGGAQATYSVIQGAPAASPIPPALTIPNEQAILGQILVPDGAVDLTGITYTKSITPDFAGDTSIAHTDRTNIFIPNQILPQQSSIWGVCYVDSGAAEINLGKDASGIPLTGQALADNLKKNYFVIGGSGTVSVTTITPYPKSFTSEVKELTFIAPRNIKFSGGITSYINLPTESRSFYPFKLITNEDTVIGTGSNAWYLLQGNEALLDGYNKFNKLQSWGKTTGTFTGTRLNTGSDGNFIDIVTTPITKTIGNINPISVGTIFYVKGTGEPLTFLHNIAGTGKPLWILSERTLTSTADNEVFVFIEDTNYFRLVGTYSVADTWHYVADPSTGLGSAFIDYGNSTASTQLRFRNVSDNKVRLEGEVVKTVLTSTNNVICTLPIGFRPDTTRIYVVDGNTYNSAAAGNFLGHYPTLIAVSANGNVTALIFAGFISGAQVPVSSEMNFSIEFSKL